MEYGASRRICSHWDICHQHVIQFTLNTLFQKTTKVISNFWGSLFTKSSSQVMHVCFVCVAFYSTVKLTGSNCIVNNNVGLFTNFGASASLRVKQNWNLIGQSQLWPLIFFCSIWFGRHGFAVAVHLTQGCHTVVHVCCVWLSYYDCCAYVFIIFRMRRTFKVRVGFSVTHTTNCCALHSERAFAWSHSLPRKSLLLCH